MALFENLELFISHFPYYAFCGILIWGSLYVRTKVEILEANIISNMRLKQNKKGD